MDRKKLSLGDLNRIHPDEFAQTPKTPIIIIANQIRSGQNVGSLFRTADSFAFNKIALVGITPTPPNKEIAKSALGSTETVDWIYFEHDEACISWLKSNHYVIVAVEQTTDAIMLQNFIPDVTKKYALVMGNEVDGVSDLFIKNADLCIEIPQIGTKHSLNVAVCAGIVSWHFAKGFLPI